MSHFVPPTIDLKASFLAAMAEFADEGRMGDGSGIGRDLEEWGRRWHDPAVFAQYVSERIGEAEGTPAEGWVRNTNLWWVDGHVGAEQYIGRMSIRHELNDDLRELGGHIGYDVRRSRRREGHATAMLAAALPIARDLGIRSALVTCDTDNVGSRVVIERNGGVFEDQRGGKLRYWVPTAAGG